MIFNYCCKYIMIYMLSFLIKIFNCSCVSESTFDLIFNEFDKATNFGSDSDDVYYLEGFKFDSNIINAVLKHKLMLNELLYSLCGMVEDSKIEYFNIDIVYTKSELNDKETEIQKINNILDGFELFLQINLEKLHQWKKHEKLLADFEISIHNLNKSQIFEESFGKFIKAENKIISCIFLKADVIRRKGVKISDVFSKIKDEFQKNQNYANPSVFICSDSVNINENSPLNEFKTSKINYSLFRNTSKCKTVKLYKYKSEIEIRDAVNIENPNPNITRNGYDKDLTQLEFHYEFEINVQSYIIRGKIHFENLKMIFEITKIFFGIEKNVSEIHFQLSIMEKEKNEYCLEWFFEKYNSERGNNQLIRKIDMLKSNILIFFIELNSLVFQKLGSNTAEIVENIIQYDDIYFEKLFEEIYITIKILV